MAIRYDILGERGRDNAAFVWVDTGQAVHRLLFDCGEGCPQQVGGAELMAVDHVFFSHFHIDHIAGFDSFFRYNYNRPGGPVHAWGPADTIDVLGGRLRGFTWNLVKGQPGRWDAHAINEQQVHTARFRTSEGFRKAHDLGARPFEGVILDTDAYTVSARILDHGAPSIGYLVREHSRTNISKEAMEAMGVPEGPWLRHIKDASTPDDALIFAGERQYTCGELRSRLLRETKGESLAYLTDFRMDAAEEERLADFLRGCGTLVCEGQYGPDEADLASANHHLTVLQAAGLAAKAGVERLVLFHVSSRYGQEQITEILELARGIFPATEMPARWMRPRRGRTRQ